MKKNTTTNRIALQRTSRRLRRVFEVALVVCPLAPLLLYLAYNQLPVGFRTEMFRPLQTFPSSLALNARLLLCGAALPSLAVTAFFLLTVRGLCLLYEQGAFFEKDTVRHYRLLGTLLLLKVLAGIFHGSMQTLALTLNNPPGQREISLSVSSGDAQLLVGAVILMLLGRLMEEGRHLQEDSRLTI